MSKVSVIEFMLAASSASDSEELISRVCDDPDYDGFLVEWDTPTSGRFLMVPEEETELFAVWWVGTNGIEFDKLTYDGVDLLKKHARAIKKERAIDPRTGKPWR